MRFGICANLTDAAAVKAGGFDYLELGVQPTLQPREEADPTASVTRALDAAGIRCEAMNVLLPGALKVTGPGVDEKALSRYMQRVGERARRLGTETIVFGSGVARMVPENFPRPRARSQLLAFLKIAGDALGPHGVTLAIEPLQKAETNVINTVSDGAALAREANHPAVRLLADAYHMACDGEPWDACAAAGDLLVHAHLAEPTERRAPGTKEYDYAPFLGALARGGYKGRVSIEGKFDDLREQALRALTVLRDAERRALGA